MQFTDRRAMIPRIGLVIATFAGVPYIHLGLESRRRYYPNLPALVSDDASHETNALARLCEQYGAAFVSNQERKGHAIGDMSAFVNGFEWCREQGVEVLVKMSRRFVPLYNWLPGLQRLASEGGGTSYGNHCRHYHFPFRTECCALEVSSWFTSGVVEELRGYVSRNEKTDMEKFMHKMAGAVSAHAARDSTRTAPVNATLIPRAPYVTWNILNSNRHEKHADVLWHDCDTPLDYYRIARAYGLQYLVSDFYDPNEGAGGWGSP